MTTSDPRLSTLPGVARELAEQTEYAAGERLLLHFAGQRVFVPKKIWPRSILWKTLGPIAAKTLSEMFGGEYIEVPTGEGLSRKKRVAQARALLTGAGRKLSKNQAAAQLRIHRRTVQRHRAWISRKDDRQPSLKF